MTNPDSKRAPEKWLPDMDLNHDKQIQSLLCYRYTIGQTNDSKVGVRTGESRLGSAVTPIFPRTGRSISGVAQTANPRYGIRATTAMPRPTESRRYN
jgi:hypothetical protein